MNLITRNIKKKKKKLSLGDESLYTISTQNKFNRPIIIIHSTLNVPTADRYIHLSTFLYFKRLVYELSIKYKIITYYIISILYFFLVYRLIV